MLEKQGQAEWHAFPTAEALARLESHPEGLSETETQQRPSMIDLVGSSVLILAELEKLFYCAGQRRRGLGDAECGRR